MIFNTLNSMKIPYIVIRYAETLVFNDEIIRYRYQIITDYQQSLKRLGFNLEREIMGKKKMYMYRDLSAREVNVFKTYQYLPKESNNEATIWEFNGKVERWSRKPQKREGNGRFT